MKKKEVVNETNKETDISDILQMTENDFIYKLCFMDKKDLIMLKEIFTIIFDIAITMKEEK